MSAGVPHLLIDRVRDELIASGTWVARARLGHLSSSVVALDDALADLVIEGRAEFREAVGYRIAGTELTRGALRRLHRHPELNRVVLAKQKDLQLRLGVAERRQAIGLVSYEMELPPAADPESALAQAQTFLNYWNDNMELKDGRTGL